MAALKAPWHEVNNLSLREGQASHWCFGRPIVVYRGLMNISKYMLAPVFSSKSDLE